MQFVKYHSIENHYNNKVVDSFAENYGHKKFVAVEKIHGSNISIIWAKNNPSYRYAKRTSFVEPGEKFYNIHNVIDTIDPVLKKLYSVINDIATESFTLYGELYGGTVQKEIKYRDDQSIVFYDLVIDNKTVSWQFLSDLFARCELSDYLVPLLFVTDSIKEAVTKDIENLTSKLSVYPDQPIEGVVIRPLDEEFVHTRYGRCVVKYKTQKFSELRNSPSKYKNYAETVLNESELAVDALAVEVFNSNRIASVLSKVDEDFRDRKNIGALVKLLIEDAIEELVKLDHPVYIANKNTFGKRGTKIAFKEMIKSL